MVPWGSLGVLATSGGEESTQHYFELERVVTALSTLIPFHSKRLPFPL